MSNSWKSLFTLLTFCALSRQHSALCTILHTLITKLYYFTNMKFNIHIECHQFNIRFLRHCCVWPQLLDSIRFALNSNNTHAHQTHLCKDFFFHLSILYWFWICFFTKFRIVETKNENTIEQAHSVRYFCTCCLNALNRLEQVNSKPFSEH